MTAEIERIGSKLAWRRNPFRRALIAFCKWRVYRLGKASGRWLNWSWRVANGEFDDLPEYHK